MILEKLRNGIFFLGFVVLGLNFLISGIAINAFQAFLWITLKPINLWLYRKVNYYCTFAVWGQLEFLAEWWSGSSCIIHTDDKTWAKMGTEHAMLLLNHSFEVDWIFSWFMCEQIRTLGCPRALVKSAFKKVPIIGWTATFSENAFLERNWETDKFTIEKQINNMSNNPDPVMLHIFAEGTRYTPAKHAASVEFARKSNLQPLKHLLLPRTKGFVLCLDILRNKFPAVYCATLVFNTKDGADPVFKSLLFGRPIACEILLERIPLDSIPEDPNKAAEWLHKAYVHKDKMIDMYKTEGRFPHMLPSKDHHFDGPIRAHYRPRRFWTVLVIAVSCWLSLPPVFGALFSLFCSGLVNLMIGVLLVALVIFALLKLMDLSSASKGSQYGQTPRAKAS